MSFVRRVVSFTVGVALVPLTAGAQPLGKIVVTPYVGAYAPANELARMRAHRVGNAVAANVAQRNGLALGATGALWFAPRVSVELGAVYVWSDLSSEFAFSQPGSLGSAVPVVDNAGLLMGAAKLMVGLFPATSDFQLRFGAGPAIITRIGSAYKADADGKITGRTDLGGALSLCTKVPIGSRVALRLRVEDYMYQARLGWQSATNPAASFRYEERFQHDLVLSAGLQIGLMR